MQKLFTCVARLDRKRTPVAAETNYKWAPRQSQGGPKVPNSIPSWHFQTKEEPPWLRKPIPDGSQDGPKGVPKSKSRYLPGTQNNRINFPGLEMPFQMGPKAIPRRSQGSRLITLVALSSERGAPVTSETHSRWVLRWSQGVPQS